MSYVTYTVWSLREGAHESDLLVLIEEQIEPRYAALHDGVRLGLARLDDGHYLATQHWPDRATYDAATSGADYDRWWARYQGVLALWSAAATLEQEWAGEELR